MQTRYLHLPDSYVINPEPKYCDRPPESINWQIAQYEYASNLSKKYNCQTIIDVGAGDGKKLNKFFDCNKIAIEFGENYNKCKEIIPETREFDLDSSWFKLPHIKDYGIVCIDVIEHLKNPTKLLESLNACDWWDFILFTTPERELIHGVGNLGPPINPAHVREWKLSEFQSLIRDFFYRDPHMGLIGEKGKPTCMYALLTSV